MVSKIKKHETEEEKFIRLFNLGFEQVVAPAMEGMEEELKLEMKGLKKEVGGLKEEMGGLKEKTEGLKKETEGLKKETEGLKKETESLKKDMKQGFEQVNAKIDSHDRRTDDLATQIGDHEKRIKKLESKGVLTA